MGGCVAFEKDRPLNVDEGREVVAARFRASARAPAVAAKGEPVSVTLSIGVAARTAHMRELDVLIEEADQQLYRAKREGRDRICTPMALDPEEGQGRVTGSR